MELTPHMITIDCADAGRLAAWWADALGVEIAQDFGEFVMVAAEPLVLGFQKVPEPRVGKNRLHIDFSAPDRVAAVDRLVGLGATVVGDRSAPGLTWTTMRDPDGNEFCVSG
ncbi:VOC family protein [Embleya hyalina]|uniref:Glyoxalase n=1 Tax=Embleya hyalina TaxID=516124 RepID=A0A401YTT8_9ACTN|nr:VOC family protein [Embleya hyalina]GCD98017.1 glyoxalase [Embleya hyalina]